MGISSDANSFILGSVVTRPSGYLPCSVFFCSEKFFLLALLLQSKISMLLVESLSLNSHSNSWQRSIQPWSKSGAAIVLETMFYLDFLLLLLSLRQIISGLGLTELLLPWLNRGSGRGAFSHWVVVQLMIFPGMALKLLSLVLLFFHSKWSWTFWNSAFSLLTSMTLIDESELSIAALNSSFFRCSKSSTMSTQ